MSPVFYAVYKYIQIHTTVRTSELPNLTNLNFTQHHTTAVIEDNSMDEFQFMPTSHTLSGLEHNNTVKIAS